MIRIFFLILALLSFGPHCYVSASSGDDTARIEAELKQIEETRRQAIKNGDEKILDQIYADDFTAIAGSGQIVNKQQLMAVFKRNDPAITFTTDEIHVRVFGSTALFTGRLVGRNDKGETTTASRFTHVFVQRDGRWQCVAGQSTPLAQVRTQ